MNDIRSKEVVLWLSVMEQAILDAKADNKRNGCGTEKIYKWSRGSDCKEVCYYAQLNHDDIRIKFINIYLEFLSNEIIFIESEILRTRPFMCAETKIELDSLNEKVEEAYNRLEKIECQTL